MFEGLNMLTHGIYRTLYEVTGPMAGGLWRGAEMRDATHQSVGLNDGGTPDGFGIWARCPLTKIFIRES